MKIFNAKSARETVLRVNRKNDEKQIKDIEKHIRKAAAQGYTGIKYEGSLSSYAVGILRENGYVVKRLKDNSYVISWKVSPAF